MSRKSIPRTPPRARAIPADKLGEPHAQLRDAAGKLLGGVVFKDGEWVLGLDGRIAGSSPSAAHALALIKQAAAVCRADGRDVSLVFSARLRAAAHEEAAAEGLAFEAFQARLLAQMNGDPAAD
jgi:hypothetical protein